MTGPTTQEYQPLSQALQFQNQQPDLPRLQLAPPEHQKQLPQAQAKQPQETHEQPPVQPSPSSAAQRPDERVASTSSREVSPIVGVESSQPSNGQKRKLDNSKGGFKKRKTEQAKERIADAAAQYALGTHYPYAYAYPGAPPPPPGLNPPQASTPPADMGFNEFQWRLLNLCGEFYEAATELIRSTPHLVLSQAFQILDRGTGVDPISVLNDARRTCDMLLTNPQALSTAPPPPITIPLPALTSLAHLSSRPSSNSTPAPAPVITPSSYYPPQSTSLVVENFNPKSKEKERAPANVQGTWKDEEIQKLKALAEKHKIGGTVAVAEEEEEEEEEEDGAQAEGNAENGEGSSAHRQPKKTKSSENSEVDWDKVIAEFGDGRSRHQVLIKATYLGLKPSSSLPGKKPKKKRTVSTARLPPPLTFSSASAKTIPSGYNPSHHSNSQSPSGASNSNAPTVTTVQSKPVTMTIPQATANDSHKANTAAPPPVPPQHHLHTHGPYSQPGWYPHPQNPYYAYPQPMYYSPHPQAYGVQGYGIQPPPQGYYPPPYTMPPGSDVPPVDKLTQTKGKRRDARRDDTQTAPTSTTPVPPPSLPPKPIVDTTPSTKPALVTSTAGVSKPADAPANDVSTPQPAPTLSSSNTPTGTGSSGVLRRGPNNSLFTYTPLSHGSATSTEQGKEPA